MVEKKFHTGLISINYVEGPDSGLPLLLLHGGSSTWHSFESIIPDLQEKYHVFAIDLRGHGKSDRVSSGYKIEDYIPDIISFIENCIKEPAILFGHSLGGMISIMVAAKQPKLVKALIIGDSPISLEVLKEHSENQKDMITLWRELAKDKPIDYIVEQLKHMLIPNPKNSGLVPAYKIFGENHPWFKFMAESLSQNDPDMLTAIIDHFDETYRAYEVDVLFPEIECPVLILQGNPMQGGLIRDEDIIKASKLLKDMRYKKIDNVGHSLHMQDKQAVIDVIIPFIKSL